MSDWSSGYVADVGYTFGYYAELNPYRTVLPLLNAGLAVPKWENACELGFGQGVSVNIHAAAGTTQWWGTDFNPEQAGFAQELAREGGNGARLFDQSFAEFCSRTDLPDFDFVALHGIWSWISDENRAVIVDFLRRKLKVGGVVYVSYNTLPGWAPMLPVRHLMTQHVKSAGASGSGLPARIGDSLAFLDKLMALDPAYGKLVPAVADRIKRLHEHDRNYLAHEYFNRDWEPMQFADMAQWMSSAKMSYAATASYLHHVDAVNMTPAQMEFLHEVSDPVLRETVRDFLTNQQFRRDLWIKGARRWDSLRLAEAMRDLRATLVTAPEDVSMKIESGLGPLTMHENIYKPILEALADRQAREIREVASRVAAAGVTYAQVMQAVLVLGSRGDIALRHEGADLPEVRARTDRFNQSLIERARGSADVAFLASPVTGGGVSVPRFHQMFILARQKGAKTADDLARAVWKMLSQQGQRLVKDGQAVASEEDNIAGLAAEARTFLDKRVPLLRALGVTA